MKKLLVICIVVFAFLLRTYNVTKVPPSLSWDEVSIGYNAYSILKTGRDEHGKFLPLDAFAAYGDYKPPLSIYITVPFVALFGLSELAVRLPSVIFGTGAVVLLYFVTLELFQKSERKKTIALITSLSVAISPWHINLSRAGFEANIGLFFVVLGVYFALIARKHPRIWLWTWLPFVAGVYTFNSTRFFVPFMGLGLVAYCRKSMMNAKRYVALGAIIAVVALLPILPHLVSKEAQLRFVEVNIFTDLSIVKTANDRIAYDNHSLLSEILDNRRVGYARSFLTHYFDHFTSDFLFIKGDGNPKFSTQDVGELYLIDLPFLLIGAYCMFAYFPGEAMLVSYWLLAAIIPAATARETPHALRILNSLPAWHLFIALGLVMFFYTIIKQRKILITILVCGGYLLSVGYYLHNYYVHYPRLYSNEWQYGYKQALSYVNANGSKYKTIYLSESIGRAYMYTLFYTKYDPGTFQKSKSSYFDAAGFYHVNGFGMYVFADVAPEVLDNSSLYIFPSNQVPTTARVLQTISLLDGEPVLTIFEK
ncbi:MAG: glycosyltransferase family 39 protein [Candidatus Gottesmanbacteria bacterium]|nr:glycosyltransferase family 39 protein [Candidatus Gottesmanbacteria bacterium]